MRIGTRPGCWFILALITVLATVKAQTNDPCSSQTCLNGGTCHTLPIDGYRCECTLNFLGTRCEKELNLGNMAVCQVVSCPKGQLCVPVTSCEGDSCAVDSLCVEMRAGTCPPSNVSAAIMSILNAGASSCTFGCLLDVSCPGSQKCCMDGCSSRCTDPQNLDASLCEQKKAEYGNLLQTYNGLRSITNITYGQVLEAVRQLHAGNNSPLNSLVGFALTNSSGLEQFTHLSLGEVISRMASVIPIPRIQCTQNGDRFASVQCDYYLSGALAACRCVDVDTGESRWKVSSLGSTCDAPEPCSSDPCLYGGVCTSKADGNFSCECDRRYMGKTCETYIGDDNCLTIGCQNEGSCVTSKCFCLNGYGGRWCENRVPICEWSFYKDFCRHGTCATDPLLGIRCVCDPGYFGARCEQPVFKGGLCPTLSASEFWTSFTRNSSQCVAHCRSDSQCPTNQRCCMDGCSQRCQPPGFSVLKPCLQERRLKDQAMKFIQEMGALNSSLRTQDVFMVTKNSSHIQQVMATMSGVWDLELFYGTLGSTTFSQLTNAISFMPLPQVNCKIDGSYELRQCVANETNIVGCHCVGQTGVTVWTKAPSIGNEPLDCSPGPLANFSGTLELPGEQWANDLENPSSDRYLNVSQTVSSWVRIALLNSTLWNHLHGVDFVALREENGHVKVEYRIKMEKVYLADLIPYPPITQVTPVFASQLQKILMKYLNTFAEIQFTSSIIADKDPNDPCLTCTDNQMCHYQQVQCVTTPCYPVRVCVDPDSPEVSLCQTGFCHNGGTCSVTGAGQVECRCTSQYEGKYCHISKERCKSVARCENGGACLVDEMGVESCRCPATYTGMFCETAIVTPTCDNMACQEGQRCEMKQLCTPGQTSCTMYPQCVGRMVFNVCPVANITQMVRDIVEKRYNCSNDCTTDLQCGTGRKCCQKGPCQMGCMDALIGLSACQYQETVYLSAHKDLYLLSMMNGNTYGDYLDGLAALPISSNSTLFHFQSDLVTNMLRDRPIADIIKKMYELNMVPAAVNCTDAGEYEPFQCRINLDGSAKSCHCVDTTSGIPMGPEAPFDQLSCTEKLGSCPHVTPNNLNCDLTTPRCTTDQDCDDHLKCCTLPCGSLGCQQPAVPCSVNHCENGGRCRVKADVVGEVECVCLDHYAGDTCQTYEGTVCDDQPCLNGGSCRLHTELDFSCSCPFPYFGDACQLSYIGPKDPCSNLTCGQDETCLVVDSCDDMTGVCTPQPQCFGAATLLTMTCESDYAALYCTKRANCYQDKYRIHRCICRQGFSGERCKDAAERAGICPVLNFTAVILSDLSDTGCADSCSYDLDCGGTMKCCMYSERCGKQCTTPLADTTTTCREQFKNASMINMTLNYLSDLTSVTVTEFFNKVDKKVLNVIKRLYMPGATMEEELALLLGLLGDQSVATFVSSAQMDHPIFVPDCTADGRFHAVQCLYDMSGSASMCSCVNVKTGEHWGESATSSVNLNCDEKPGTCRMADVSVCAEPTCASDNECSGGKKCCNVACGHTCLEPTELSCSSNPCVHGTCQAISTTFYLCVCDQGYSGKKCDIYTPNTCDSNSSLCVNGGTCYDQIGSANYTCKCLSDFIGRHCEFRNDGAGCNSSPCMNGATCYYPIRSNVHACQCRSGFHGERCQFSTRENGCTSNPCQNEASCSPVGTTNFTCVCTSSRYYGRFCQWYEDAMCTYNSRNYSSGDHFPAADCNSCSCATNGIVGCTKVFCGPTLHGTLTLNETWSPVLYNKSSAQFKQLETRVTSQISGALANTILSQYIGNIKVTGARPGSIVIDIGISFNSGVIIIAEGSPHPTDGTLGLTISRILKELRQREDAGDLPRGTIDSIQLGSLCDSQRPCLNGGTCLVNIPEGFLCICERGYTGPNCEYTIVQNGCTNNPCQHRASCTPVGASNFTCGCFPPYYGQHCEFTQATTSPAPGKSCAQNPCMFGSTCLYDSRYGYRCICRQGFTGVNCNQIVVNPGVCPRLDYVLAIRNALANGFRMSCFLDSNCSSTEKCCVGETGTACVTALETDKSLCEQQRMTMDIFNKTFHNLSQVQDITFGQIMNFARNQGIVNYIQSMFQLNLTGMSETFAHLEGQSLGALINMSRDVLALPFPNCTGTPVTFAPVQCLRYLNGTKQMCYCTNKTTGMIAGEAKMWPQPLNCDPVAAVCVINGIHYHNGENVPSTDCNTCTCHRTGYVVCTTIACGPVLRGIFTLNETWTPDLYNQTSTKYKLYASQGASQIRHALWNSSIGQYFLDVRVTSMSPGSIVMRIKVFLGAGATVIDEGAPPPTDGTLGLTISRILKELQQREDAGQLPRGTVASMQLVEQDGCSDNPCRNGGTCLPMGKSGFFCNCNLGYLGQFCKLWGGATTTPPSPGNMTACERRPCMNGGTCHGSGHNDYMCYCRSMYYGKHCEHYGTSNPCALVDCVDGHECRVERRCRRSNMSNIGHTDCEDDAVCVATESCSNRPCMFGSTCLYDSLHGYQCFCRHGFKGRNCDQIMTNPGVCPRVDVVRMFRNLTTLTLACALDSNCTQGMKCCANTAGTACVSPMAAEKSLCEQQRLTMDIFKETYQNLSRVDDITYGQILNFARDQGILQFIQSTFQINLTSMSDTLAALQGRSLGALVNMSREVLALPFPNCTGTPVTFASVQCLRYLNGTKQMCYCANKTTGEAMGRWTKWPWEPVCETRNRRGCEWNTCRNGGTCQPNEYGDFKCHCLFSYYGNRCEYSRGGGNMCMNKHCPPGTQCRVVTECTDFVISDNHTSQNCTARPVCAGDGCASSPCMFGSTCLEDSNRGYRCLCRREFMGRNCDQILTYPGVCPKVDIVRMLRNLSTNPFNLRLDCILDINCTISQKCCATSMGTQCQQAMATDKSRCEQQRIVMDIFNETFWNLSRVDDIMYGQILDFARNQKIISFVQSMFQANLTDMNAALSALEGLSLGALVNMSRDVLALPFPNCTGTPVAFAPVQCLRYLNGSVRTCYCVDTATGEMDGPWVIGQSGQIICKPTIDVCQGVVCPSGSWCRPSHTGVGYRCEGDHSTTTMMPPTDPCRFVHCPHGLMCRAVRTCGAFRCHMVPRCELRDKCTNGVGRGCVKPSCPVFPLSHVSDVIVKTFSPSLTNGSCDSGCRHDDSCSGTGEKCCTMGCKSTCRAAVPSGMSLCQKRNHTMMLVHLTWLALKPYSGRTITQLIEAGHNMTIVEEIGRHFWPAWDLTTVRQRFGNYTVQAALDVLKNDFVFTSAVCREDGLFASGQCDIRVDGSLGECYCVRYDGKRRPGSQQGLGCREMTCKLEHCPFGTRCEPIDVYGGYQCVHDSPVTSPSLHDVCTPISCRLGQEYCELRTDCWSGRCRWKAHCQPFCVNGMGPRCPVSTCPAFPVTDVEQAIRDALSPNSSCYSECWPTNGCPTGQQCCTEGCRSVCTTPVITAMTPCQKRNHTMMLASRAIQTLQSFGGNRTISELLNAGSNMTGIVDELGRYFWPDWNVGVIRQQYGSLQIGSAIKMLLENHKLPSAHCTLDGLFKVDQCYVRADGSPLHECFCARFDGTERPGASNIMDAGCQDVTCILEMNSCPAGTRCQPLDWYGKYECVPEISTSTPAPWSGCHNIVCLKGYYCGRRDDGVFTCLASEASCPVFPLSDVSQVVAKTFSPSLTNGSCDSECRYDDSCSGENEKCCTMGCKSACTPAVKIGMSLCQKKNHTMMLVHLTWLALKPYSGHTITQLIEAGHNMTIVEEIGRHFWPAWDLTMVRQRYGNYTVQAALDVLKNDFNFTTAYCTGDGLYSYYQCDVKVDGSVGVCYCVGYDGKERYGTRYRQGLNCRDMTCRLKSCPFGSDCQPTDMYGGHRCVPRMATTTWRPTIMTPSWRVCENYFCPNGTSCQPLQMCSSCPYEPVCQASEASCPVFPLSDVSQVVAKTFSLSLTNGSCDSECRYDDSCSGENEKCCTMGCKSVCTPAVKIGMSLCQKKNHTMMLVHLTWLALKPYSGRTITQLIEAGHNMTIVEEIGRHFWPAWDLTMVRQRYGNYTVQAALDVLKNDFNFTTAYCTGDGLYSYYQCDVKVDGSVGVCYCVGYDGKERYGTRYRQGLNCRDMTCRLKSCPFGSDCQPTDMYGGHRCVPRMATTTWRPTIMTPSWRVCENYFCPNGTSCQPLQMCSSCPYEPVCQDLDPCVMIQHLCLHGSTCVIDPVIYARCVCRAGYVGSFCERPLLKPGVCPAMNATVLLAEFRGNNSKCGFHSCKTDLDCGRGQMKCCLSDGCSARCMAPLFTDMSPCEQEQQIQQESVAVIRRLGQLDSTLTVGQLFNGTNQNSHLWAYIASVAGYWSLNYYFISTGPASFTFPILAASLDFKQNSIPFITCSGDGEYARRQCAGSLDQSSTEFCYCARRNGMGIYGTRGYQPNVTQSCGRADVTTLTGSMRVTGVECTTQLLDTNSTTFKDFETYFSVEVTKAFARSYLNFHYSSIRITNVSCGSVRVIFDLKFEMVRILPQGSRPVFYPLTGYFHLDVASILKTLNSSLLSSSLDVLNVTLSVCPLRKCEVCKSGYLFDELGCRTCRCVDPCEKMQCLPGTTCTPTASGIFTCLGPSDYSCPAFPIDGVRETIQLAMSPTPRVESCDSTCSRQEDCTTTGQKCCTMGCKSICRDTVLKMTPCQEKNHTLLLLGETWRGLQTYSNHTILQLLDAGQNMTIVDEILRYFRPEWNMAVVRLRFGNMTVRAALSLLRDYTFTTAYCMESGLYSPYQCEKGIDDRLPRCFCASYNGEERPGSTDAPNCKEFTCTQVQCPSGQYCFATDFYGSYYCLSDPHTSTTTTTSRPIDVCQNHVCSNGTYCEVKEKCPIFGECVYKPFCRKNPCVALQPLCQHGSTCDRDPLFSARCVCRPGFYGSFCERPLLKPGVCPALNATVLLAELRGNNSQCGFHSCKTDLDCGHGQMKCCMPDGCSARCMAPQFTDRSPCEQDQQVQMDSVAAIRRLGQLDSTLTVGQLFNGTNQNSHIWAYIASIAGYWSLDYYFIPFGAATPTFQVLTVSLTSSQNSIPFITCSDDGEFERRQCAGSLDENHAEYCYCARRTGMEIYGTRSSQPNLTVTCGIHDLVTLNGLMTVTGQNCTSELLEKDSLFTFEIRQALAKSNIDFYFSSARVTHLRCESAAVIVNFELDFEMVKIISTTSKPEFDRRTGYLSITVSLIEKTLGDMLYNSSLGVRTASVGLRRCPSLSCDTSCSSGYRQDEFACRTCQCVDPCENLQCSEGYECGQLESGRLACVGKAPSCKEKEVLCVFAGDSAPSCVPEEFMCDGGEPDCENGLDEANCTTIEPIRCSTGSRKCPNEETCVLNERWCDGYIDCYNHMDEVDCPTTTTVADTTGRPPSQTLQITLKLNATFTEDLNDKSSPAYKELENQILAQMRITLTSGFPGELMPTIRITGFRPSSILVDVVIEFSPNVTIIEDGTMRPDDGTTVFTVTEIRDYLKEQQILGNFPANIDIDSIQFTVGPATTTTAKPAITTTDKPAITTTAKPAITTTSKPAITTTMAKPAITTTAKPATTTTAKPATTTTAKPAITTTDKPAITTTAKPAITTTSKPAITTTMAKPAITTTAKPATTTTAKPAITTTAKPAITTTAKPAITTTAKPAITTTAKPAITTTAKPATTTTGKPTTVCTYTSKIYNPGATFPSTDGCSTCSCGTEGNVHCTEIGCACTYNGATRNPGSTFPSIDGCNTCSCTADGTVGCTEMACVCSNNGKTYSPGATFESIDGCNTCTCNNDFTVSCTEKACACTYNGATRNPGATFPSIDGCNTCTCNADGTVGCTEMACDCPDVSQCRAVCKHGRQKNSENCKICDCNEPCEDLDCAAENKVCVVQGDDTASCQTEKLGYCPSPRSLGEMCNKECRYDASCDGDKKCCWGTCGTRCVDPLYTMPRNLTACEERLENAALQLSRHPTNPVAIPRCEADSGDWSPVQCHDSWGVCHCVDSMGVKVNGTRVRGTRLCHENAPSGTDVTVCPNNQAIHQCNPGLCLRQHCLRFPDAVCRINPCDGCSAKFYDDDNNVVNCIGTDPSPCFESLEARLESSQPGSWGGSISEIQWRIWAQLRHGEQFDMQPKAVDEAVMKSSEYPVDFCGLSFDRGTGPDDAHNPRWFYNVRTGQCQFASYSGTGGNLNRFASAEECARVCVESASAAPSFRGSAIPDCTTDGTSFENKQCHDGSCWCVDNDGTPVTGSLTRGDLTCSNGVVTAAVRSACPNANTPMICADTCAVQTCGTDRRATCYADPCNNCAATFTDMHGLVISCESPSVCTKSADPGNCDHHDDRWFYNATGRQCQRFVFGGCNGNENNFATRGACIAKCYQEPDDSKPLCDNGAAPVICPDMCHETECYFSPDAACMVDVCANCEPIFYTLDTETRVDCNRLSTKCQRERAQRTRQEEDPQYLPQCVNVTGPSFGEYKPKQCDRMNCWCVSGEGEEMAGTKADHLTIARSNGLNCVENKTVEAKISFKIEIAFDSVNMDELEAAIRAAIDILFKKVQGNIKSITFSVGSIKVDMTLEDEENTDLSEQINFLEGKMAQSQLSFQVGNLTLTPDPSSVTVNRTFAVSPQVQPTVAPTTPVGPVTTELDREGGISSMDLRMALAIGISIGVIALAVIIGLIVVHCRSKKHKKGDVSYTDSGESLVNGSRKGWYYRYALPYRSSFRTSNIPVDSAFYFSNPTGLPADEYAQAPISSHHVYPSLKHDNDVHM